MNNSANTTGSYLVFIILLAFFTSIFATEDDLGNPFLVHCLNDQVIFLNMSENEISKRLGEALNILKDEGETYYFYDDLTIRCSDGRVDGIFFSSKDISVLHGVRSGKRVYKIPLIHRTIFGLSFFSSANVLDEELEELTTKNTIEYKITARDNLGNKRLLAGEILDKPQSTYILKIYSGEGKIGIIELYNSIEISDEHRLIYVDL